MRAVRVALSSLFALAVAVGVAWLIWKGLRLGANYFAALESEQAGAVVAASGTFLVAVFTVVLTNRSNKVREIAEAHRPEKVKVYDGFMDLMIEVLKSTKAGEIITVESAPTGFMDRWFDFKRGMVVWASPRAIRAYVQFENASQKKTTEGLQVLDNVLRELRRDLGNSNRGLPPLSLIGMFLTPEARSEVGLAERDAT